MRVVPRMNDPTGTAGRGRLAELLATRGGRSDPEAPFVIEHREALIYMLCEAAELERVEAGTMPCDGAWPAERVAVFRRWIEAGNPA
jgi:hypothetical protein